MLNFFSEELKNRREEVGLTIQQIASKTRIDKKYIEFMEQGNFSFLPELYVKSFIREYASIVDLDPDETIKKYQLAKEGRLISEAEKKDSSEITEEKKHIPEHPKTEAKSFVDENVANQPQNQSNKKNGNLIIISSAVLGLIIIIIVYFFITSKNDIVIEETPFEEIVNQETDRFEESTESAEDISSISTDSLSLEISSKDSTWVYLILDNSTVNEFILYPNNKTVVKAKSTFEGTIGNSGSTVLKLNDRNLDFLGRKNLPRHFRLNKSVGLEYLNTRPIFNNQDVNR
jgi:cytoskeletal protein RodZ